MFYKGTMRDDGIDITIKNNPDHVLSPNDWQKVLDAKFGKISKEEYLNWYKNLLKNRWMSRKSEFIELAKEGLKKNIKLKCYCHMTEDICHAYAASAFMNKLIEVIKK